MELGLKYYLKAVAATGVIAALQVVVLISFFKLTLDPPADVLRQLAEFIVPLVVVLLIVFGLIGARMLMYFTAFLRASPDDHSYSDPDLAEIQRRLVNVSYQIAGVAFLFYALAAPAGSWYLTTMIPGWGPRHVAIGLIGGLIAGMLNVPLTVYATNFITGPIILRAFEFSETLPRASRAGMNLGVRRKLILAMFFILITSLLYTAAVSYSRTSMVLASAKEIEAAMVAAGGVVETTDRDGFQIRSMSYYESQMGDMGAFYAVVILVSAALGLIVVSLAAMEINRPVQELVARTQRLIDGDLDQEVMLVGNDELAYLAEVYNAMVGVIKQETRSVDAMAGSMARAVEQLGQTANLILSVSAEQSSGSTEQASAMHQSSATSEEIVAVAKQIAERAGHMDEAAKATLGSCQSGQEKLSRAVDGYDNVRAQIVELSIFMQRLNDRYREMFGVVEMIEGVSEQIELLALNASLEAAGAGEAGQRFTVVALATRRLATQVAEAISDIRSLITDVEKGTGEATLMAGMGEAMVDEGRALIDEVAVALDDVADKASETSAEVSEINLSTKQQTTASEQMAQSIAEVTDVANRMLEGAEEIESTITQLTKLTDELRKMVDARDKTF